MPRLGPVWPSPAPGTPPITPPGGIGRTPAAGPVRSILRPTSPSKLRTTPVVGPRPGVIGSVVGGGRIGGWLMTFGSVPTPGGEGTGNGDVGGVTSGGFAPPRISPGS